MVVPLPTPQLTVNEGQIIGSPLYSPNLTGGGKKKRKMRKRTNRKRRSTKRKIRRSKGKRMVEKKHLKYNLFSLKKASLNNSSKKLKPRKIRKTLEEFRASLKKNM